MSSMSPEEMQSERRDFMIYTIRSIFFCATIAPILVMWILFSTKRSRGQPVFWIQLLAIFLAEAIFSVETITSAAGLVDPLETWTHKLNRTWMVCRWLIGPISDAALIFRLMAFYPAQLAPLQKRASILAFPVLIKIPRLASIVTLFHFSFLGPPRPSRIFFYIRGCELCEYILQTMDNSYVSVLLLRRIYRKFYAKRLSKVPSSFATRAARLLLEAATMSFAPAVVVQAILLGNKTYQLVMEYRLYSNCLDVINSLHSINIYVSLICSLIATRWSALCNTNAVLQITAASHRKLRYDAERVRSTCLQDRVFSTPVQLSCVLRNADGIEHGDGRVGEKQFIGQEIWQESSHVERDCVQEMLQDDAMIHDHDHTQDQQCREHFNRSRRTSPYSNSRDQGMFGSGTAQQARLHLRHGIVADKDHTLLHQLMSDDELDEHATGYYFVDEEEVLARAAPEQLCSAR